MWIDKKIGKGLMPNITCEWQNLEGMEVLCILKTAWPLGTASKRGSTCQSNAKPLTGQLFWRGSHLFYFCRSRAYDERKKKTKHVNFALWIDIIWMIKEAHAEAYVLPIFTQKDDVSSAHLLLGLAGDVIPHDWQTTEKSSPCSPELLICLHWPNPGCC